MEKHLVAVSGYEAVVYMEDVPRPDDEGNPQGAANPQAAPAVVTPDGRPQHDNMNGQSNRQLLLSVMGSVNTLKLTVARQTESIDAMRAGLRRHDGTLKGLVRRIDAHPLQQLQRAANTGRGRQGTRNAPPRQQTDESVNSRAVLMHHPRNLHQLWDEYTNGVGGNKPAKFFTRAERGTCKFKYSRRKIVWDVVERLVHSGVPARDAVDRLYTHYGPQLSPTAIINLLKVDRKKKTIPQMLGGNG